MEMAYARLDGKAITDWETFHNACAVAFGFPEFYGRNMNTWIDCLTYINEGDGLSRFALQADELLLVEIEHCGCLNERVPDIFDALVTSVAVVNQRLSDVGDRPRLALMPLLFLKPRILAFIYDKR